jgi:hypothetical protein
MLGTFGTLRTGGGTTMGNVRALGTLGARTVKISDLALSIEIVTTVSTHPPAFAVPVIVISTTFALAVALALALADSVALAGAVTLDLAFALAAKP